MRDPYCNIELTERLASAVSHCPGSICNHALKKKKEKRKKTEMQVSLVSNPERKTNHYLFQQYLGP